VGLSPYGTDSYLRRQLKDKLKELKSDDKVIAREGVASLSVAELQSVSRARGMRADTADRELLERQINDWLELSLNAKLPPSLLVLSRAFTITTEARRAAGVEESETVSGAGDVSWDPREDVDALAAKERQAAAMKDIQETLATLPEEVVISVTEERQMASSRADQVARKLEFLEQEEELIEEENAERAMEEEALREERAKKEEATKALAADGAAVTAAEKHGGADAGSRAGASPDAAAADAGDADAAAKKDLAAPGPPAKKKADTGIDSVSLDEVESVVAGRRARRAAKLSRLLAALAGVSALGVERKELTSLVRKELDLYGKRLRQVQKQLVRLDGDAAVAAAVAAEGDVAAAAAIEAASAKGQPSVFSRVHARTVSPESLDGVVARETASYTAARAAAEEEERFAEPGELVPDEDAEAPASPPGASGAGFGGSLETSGETWTDADADASRGERLADPFEVVDDEDEEEEELSDLDEKPGWFRASHDARLCDRVNDRVNAMLAGVKRDLDLADDKIGTKFKVLDADGDGKISPEELVNVKEMLKDALDDEDEAHLRSILSALETDANGMIDVADLSALVGELVEKELRASEIYDDDDHDEEFELGEEARKGGAGDEDAKAAGERREGQP
jgi:DNA-binding phage protein